MTQRTRLSTRFQKILTLLCFCIPVLCVAQKAKYDSLQRALQKYKKDDATKCSLLTELSSVCALTIINRFDSGILCADRAASIAKNLNNGVLLADAYNGKVENLVRKGDYTIADSIIRIAIAINTKNNNRNGLADNFMNTSLLNGLQGDFDKCRQDAAEALRLYSSTHSNYGMANAVAFLGYTYKYTDRNDTAIVYFNRADSLYALAGYKYKSAFLFIDLAHIYVNQGNTKNAIELIRKAIAYYQEDKNQPGLAMCYHQMATAYGNLGDDKSEMQANIAALKILEELHDLKEQANCLQSIGRILAYMDEYAPALSYLQRGLAMAKAANNAEKGINGLESVVMCYNSIGLVYIDLDDNKKALRYFDSALTAAVQLKSSMRLAETYNNTGDAYAASKDYTQAIASYRTALRFGEEGGDIISISGNLGELGKVILAAPAADLREAGIDPSEKFTMAETYLLKDLDITKQQDFLYLNRRNTLYNLSKLYEQKQDYKRSLFYLNAYADLQDTISNTEKTKAITAQQIQYETGKKEQEIITLGKEKQLQQQQIETQKLIRNGIIAGVILLLVLIGVWISRYRLKRTIAFERMQQRISADLHDDIGASLTSINILSQLSQQQKIDTATRNEYLHKMNEQTTEVTDALRDIVWSINPKNDKLDIILARMKRYAAELLESRDIGYTFTSDIVETNETLEADIRQNLYLIFKEAVNNLAKYSGASVATISMLQHGNRLHLEVNDNGNGFDPAHVKKGNGIDNMQRRAKAMSAEFSLVSKEGEGTTITVDVIL